MAKKSWPNVVCDWCNAQPGEPCKTDGGNRKSKPHKKRLEGVTDAAWNNLINAFERDRQKKA